MKKLSKTRHKEENSATVSPSRLQYRQPLSIVLCAVCLLGASWALGSAVGTNRESAWGGCRQCPGSVLLCVCLSIDGFLDGRQILSISVDPYLFWKLLNKISPGKKNNEKNRRGGAGKEADQQMQENVFQEIVIATQRSLSPAMHVQRLKRGAQYVAQCCTCCTQGYGEVGHCMSKCAPFCNVCLRGTSGLQRVAGLQPTLVPLRKNSMNHKVRGSSPVSF